MNKFSEPYAFFGWLIISGVATHLVNFALLCARGYPYVAIANLAGLLLCAYGSSNIETKRFATFLLHCGIAICASSFVAICIRHLYQNLLIECVAFALSAIGNWGRIRYKRASKLTDIIYSA